MKGVLAVLIGVMLVGCQTDCDDHESAEAWGWDPFLRIVPESSFVSNQWFQKQNVLDLKITDEGEVWILNGSKMEAAGEPPVSWLPKKQITLRVWSHPEVEYSKVRQQIGKVLLAGVERVQLVVRDFRGDFGILEIDHSVGEELTRLVPVVFQVSGLGRITVNNESGQTDVLAGITAIRERLELHRSLAELSGARPVVSVRVNDSPTYGEFVEAISKFQRTVGCVHVVDWREKERSRETFHKLIRIPKISAVPSPSIQNSPSIPKYR